MADYEDGEVVEGEPVTELDRRRAEKIAEQAQPPGAPALVRIGDPVADGYAGAGMSAVSPEDAEKLMEVFADNEHDIKPTGEVFVPQVHYRKRLNQVWRPGGWAMVPGSSVASRSGQYGKITFIQLWVMRVNEKYIGSAIGENDYIASNDNMTEPTALEGVKSNAIVRICKDLSIGWECWDKRWCDEWKKKYAKEVWTHYVGRSPALKGKKKKLWRRHTTAPFEYPWSEKD
jgi:hypothetical protein